MSYETETVYAADVEELNSLTQKLRAKGHAVKVRKLDLGFAVEVAYGKGTKMSVSNPETALPKTSGSVFYYENWQWEQGATTAARLREEGQACKYFKAKSGKCWVLKLV